MPERQRNKLDGPIVNFIIHKEDGTTKQMARNCDIENMFIRDIYSYILSLTENQPFFLEVNVNNQFKGG